MIVLPKSLAALTLLIVCQGAAHAQDAGVTYDVTARAKGKASPEALVDRSVRDLSRGDVGAAVQDDVTALQRGPLLIHGNYCGIGNRPGTKPVDALDAACSRHDACTQTGSLPNCACNDRLQAESIAIAQDPQQTPDLQALAAATAASMAVLICK